MPGRRRPHYLLMLQTLWLRAGVNNLLPVARIGGEIVAARLLIKNQVRPSAAIASVVVDTTLSVLTIFLFDLIGIVSFGLHVADGDVLMKLGIGLLASVPIIVILVLLPRLGFFGLVGKLLKKITPQKWGDVAVSSQRVDKAIMLLYRRPKRILAASALIFISWVAGALHIYIAAAALGIDLSWWEAVMLEALVQAVSSAAFAIPGALGALEFAYLFFGGLVGIAKPEALALALMRRARDLIIYLPALLVWQGMEGHWWWQRRQQKQQAAQAAALAARQTN
jgi:putative membrane protein